MEAKLFPGHPIIGNSAAEQWPKYLDRETFETVLETIVNSKGLKLKGLINVTVSPNPQSQFLIGNKKGSRRIAIHCDDPRGLIYIHMFDGSRHYNHNAMVESVFTLGELFRENFAQLQLDSYENSFLA